MRMFDANSLPIESSTACRYRLANSNASNGKRSQSTWEIGRILGMARRTAGFHLENAKAKLDVHSICQAVARLIAYRSTMKFRYPLILCICTGCIGATIRLQREKESRISAA